MKFKGMKQAGFSLVELMVVVGIIGVLAAIAVPRFQVFTAKAKQSEAKGNLRALDTLQQAFFAENGSYNSGLASIGYTIPQGNYSQPVVTAPTSGGYTASISLRSDRKLCGNVSTDNWSINNDSTLSGTVIATCN